ncbi:L,D-transpeptidase catalytic domain [Amycolatopsis tolypomycina]|uniref:L,D-transpeptidase catalytic domain n=1 Tax=Amycolatopsis tolypomycina TaxID=208445 RepID=A0A1H5DNG3_9PSEU|nr:L,D-transpeptidase [Amycolatopsis tolypomycina]SED80338.1 L,D-transpeptidase catalytic domain [Amycolatopsis tolypomycina]
MKRLLAGAAALATAFVLTACSGGGSAGVSNAGGGAVAAAGTGGGTPTTSSTTPTSATPSTSATPTPTPESTKPAPTSTSAKPKPKPTPKPAPKPAPDPSVPCAAAAAAPGTAACVDISAHKAWLLQGGKVIYGPVPMLPGRKGYETPTGKFRVLSKEKMHLSKQFDNAEMPNSVFFYPGDAFHTGSLSVYSHGCIHLSPSASLKFFNTLHIGDVVQVVP